MSRIYAERMIEKFLLDSKPSAVAFFGEWGVGKTYFWNAMVALKPKSELFAKYAYVSLFGIDSLGHLRTTVYENSVAISKLAEPASGSSIRNNISKAWHRKAKVIKPLLDAGEPYLPLGAAYDSVAAAMTNNTIVCIDDFERRSNSLDARDVLGFINYLVERRNCKVVLILNEMPTESMDYTKFKEKVFDLELKYAPTSQECSEIAIPQEHRLREKIIEFCEILEIRNIRLIHRTLRYIDSLIVEIESLTDHVLAKIAHTLVLSVWSIYGNSENKIDIELIKGRNRVRLDMARSLGKADEVSAEQARQLALLGAYNFNSADSFDLELIRYAEDGYPNPEKIREIAETIESNLKEARLDSQFFEIWDDYYESFEIGEEQIKQRLCEALQAGLGHVRPARFDEAICWFRNTDSPGLAENYANEYAKHINPNITEITSWQLNRIEDNFFKSKIVARLIELEKTETVEDVFRKIVLERQWDSKYIERVSELTQGRLVELIISFNNRRIFDWLEICFSTQFAAPDNIFDFQRNVYMATKQIAELSRINRLKLNGLLNSYAKFFEEDAQDNSAPLFPE